jgi:hypothetical protein
VLAAPLGIALGGPLTTWLGAQHTFLISAAATIAVGLATTAILLAAYKRAPAQGWKRNGEDTGWTGLEA